MTEKETENKEEANELSSLLSDLIESGATEITITKGERKKTFKYLGWANGWGDNYPEIVEKCTHRHKVEQTGRCEHRHTCEICGFYYMVDSSD